MSAYTIYSERTASSDVYNEYGSMRDRAYSPRWAYASPEQHTELDIVHI